MLGRFRTRPGNRAGLPPVNPDGSRRTRREGFLLSTHPRRQRKALRAFLLAGLVFWLALLTAVSSRASIFIDDPATLDTDTGSIASNEDIVSLLLGLNFLRYDAAATPGTVVSPVTLNGGTLVLPGPVDGEGSPLMGPVANPATTTLPLVTAGPNPVYAPGEAVFFITSYPSLANDPSLIDTVRVRVRVYDGSTLLDEETLEIYETGATTGLFTGYFQNAIAAGGPGDGLLQLPAGARIELVDLDDASDNRPESDTLIEATVDDAIANDSALFISKQAQRDVVAIGDFLQYQVRIQNTSTVDAGAVTVTDRLPRGFRYRKGSATLDGVRITDPVIAGDGVTLTFTLGTLAAGGTAADLRYVTEVTAGAKRGKAVNQATADGNNTEVSNTALATVQVTEDLFRSEAIVMGRVLSGCDAENADPEKSGIANVRLYMEDGTTVVTDSKGRYHLAGVKPGNHVLQIDRDTLPAGTVPLVCPGNTRFAGNGLSQFIDVQGGTLWRADFHAGIPAAAPPQPEETPAAAPATPVDASASLQLTSTTEYGFIHYRADISGGEALLDNVDLLISLPDQLQLVPGSLKRDGKEIEALKETDSIRRIPLGTVGTAWKIAVEFDAITRSDDAVGEAETTAWLVIHTGSVPADSPVAANLVKIHPGTGGDEVNLRVSTNFPPMAAELSGIDKLKLSDVVAQLRELGDPAITVTGHTDSSPFPKNGKKYPYANNHELSEARARAVADYLREQLALPEEAVTVIGAGPDQPIADNKTVQGRAKNRRVEVGARSRTATETGGLELLTADSGTVTARVTPDTEEEASPAEVVTGAETGVDANALAVAPPETAAPAAEETATVATPESAAGPVTGFLDFADGQNVTQRIQQFRVAMDARLTPKLEVDGVAISNDRIGFRSTDRRTNITLYSYIGVDLGERGEHAVRLSGADPFGNTRLDRTIRLVRTGDIRTVRLLTDDDSPENIADGRTPVRLRVEVLDDQQRPIMGGVTLNLVEGQLLPEHSEDVGNPLERPGTRVTVESDGTIRFQPVTQAGRYRVRLGWGENRHEDFTLFVKPHFRDWILVGIAEGSTLFRDVSGNMSQLSPSEREDGFMTDGRLAFFAKGKVKGEWLLTVAYDSAKERQDGLVDSVDPNAWYTLYGDASTRDEDAPSSRKLYLKIERENFYALFGNFDTALDTTELSRYQRRLNGVKSEYWGDRVDLMAFASETRQAYVRDALRGDGTSGLYRLRHGSVLPNSDRVTLEVRDRFDSRKVLESTTLSRFLDYTLDYDAGTLWFKEPVQAQDDGLNPVYVVVEYEVDSGAEDVTGGVRVVAHAKPGVAVGFTGVREGLGNGSSSLTGIDITAEIDARNTVTAEVAGTGTDLAATTGLPNGSPGNGDALLLRHEYSGKKLAAETYVREYGEGFGLGQNAGTESATRKLGSELRYTVSDRVKIDGEVSRQEQLDNGSSRDLAEARVNLESDRRTVFGGIRLVEEDTTAGARSSQQLLGGVRQRVDDRLELRLQGETNVAETDPNSLDYPHRLTAGADYRISAKTMLFGEQEFAWGNGQDSQHTRAGLRHAPWAGAELNTSVGQELNEYGPRIYANAGLVQNWNINAHWTADAGIDRVETLEDPGTPAFDPDVVATNGDATEDFTAMFAGAGFHDDQWRWRSRVEFRTATSEDKLNLYSGLYRELDEVTTIGGSLRYQQREGNAGDLDVTSTLQFDYVRRPLNARWIILDQALFVIDQRENSVSTLDGQRLINNFNANWQYDDRNQVAFQYGAKYVFDTIDDIRYTGYTDVTGIEYRHDITPEWDVGARTSLLNSWTAGATDESWGLFVGWSPVKNVWLSLGYNFKGFRDDDFSGASYRDQGLNLAFRLKFDQDSVREFAQDRRRAAPAPVEEATTGGTAAGETADY
ncbi:MAG: OmpA family protein [Pseudomonadota bacterium]